MSDFWKYGSGRARWGVGVGAFAAVLAFFTLVPFHYDKTVGYEVALAGVDPALAHDGERLRLLLASLGAENATVEWLRCDSVCEVKISDLSELKQCQMLVCAMKELGPVEVVEEGAAICEPASGPILELARSRVFSDRARPISDAEVKQMVTRCLGENFAASAGALACNTESMAGKCTLPCPTDSAKGCLVVTCSDGKSCCLAGDKMCSVAAGSVGGSSGCTSICSPGARVSGGATLESGSVVSDPASKQTALVPDRFALAQNQPNPFNPSTEIEFSLPASAHVRLEVYNTLGRRVRTLVDRTLSQGVHSVSWDAKSDQGERVPSGTYLYRLTAGEEVQSRTMTLLK